MPKGKRGLYESLLTEALAARLRDLDGRLVEDRRGLRPAEAADRIALHLAKLVERGLAALDENERVATGIRLARTLVAQVEAGIPKAGVRPDVPHESGTVLHALLSKLPDGNTETIPEPLIPLLDTTLLTNAPGEPRVGSQIATEIESGDRIDVVIAFIRRSGILPFLSALRRHCEAGRALRVLTTTYTGSTEGGALDALRDAGAEVRISYDTTTTRLHAKAWLFHRESGFSTAYVGSSNLTHSAQVSGLEWNVRVSGARNPDVVAKIAAVFESYWNGPEFVAYDPTEFAARTAATGRGGRMEILTSPIEIRLEPFQERLLEQIALSRERGHHRNLLVSATGTGKTVMAAIDYARIRARLERSRLLFVAHREEILDQSLATFRHALRDYSFGERWVGGDRPRRFDHVFASIQSLGVAGPSAIDPRHFDVVIVDEFHHAAARSYEVLLGRIAPVELLGLTATPERSDGLPLLHWFDERIAAELRLWDAIEQHRLSPFAYYGIHDGIDLRNVPWRRGRYDPEGLTNVLTANDAHARHVVAQVVAHVDDPRRIRALGFCVSVDHARFMARIFREAGFQATAIWADTPDAERRDALSRLRDGRLEVLFSVDLFNEGVDVPTVDTLLLLRPTDSPTLFLQQLGRGLRRSEGKTVCTVLDFVGRHRTEFRFDRRFRALLGGSRRGIVDQIERGFPFLPSGCHMELDRVASDVVLANIRDSVPRAWTAKIEELRQLSATAPEISLKDFLTETGRELEDVYAGNRSWSDLLAGAGSAVAPAGPHEATLRRACGRLIHVDDLERIGLYRRVLSLAEPPAIDTMPERERRLLRMLVASVADRELRKKTTLAAACALVWEHPQVRREIRELLDVLEDRLDHLQCPLTTNPDVPLQVHAHYTRIEILAAFGVGHGSKVSPWQTGVYWVEDESADLLAFTLDKTSGQFSPTTRYRDYALSRELIHWESQSSTAASSEPGRRFQEHDRRGSAVMLFARLRADERAFWFLGPATYVRHESERPMAITWRLTHPLPGDVFAAFAAAVA